VFENKVLRDMLEPKRDEVSLEWSISQNDEKVEHLNKYESIGDNEECDDVVWKKLAAQLICSGTTDVAYLSCGIYM
jgi:hypothetical protein